SLAKAEAGRRLDRKTFIAALFSSLNPLHADRMEAHIVPLKGSLEVKVDAALADQVGVNAGVKARVNTMLHLATTGLEHFFAGNIYRVGTSRGPKGAPTVSAILNDMLKPGDQNARSQVESASIPVIVECTAACDHAQEKIRVAR